MNVVVEVERRSGEPAKPEWTCRICHQGASTARLRANLMVCPSCGHHDRIGARERIRQLADQGSFHELWTTVCTLDPLEFVDLEPYPERVRSAQLKTGHTEAMVAGTARIEGCPCVLAVMDFGFMGGSMGSVVGERFWRCAELATTEGLPVVVVCSSGGARMQEGILSLMQMAKTTCAVDLLNDGASPFVTVLTDPCTGGVIASFATLADICIAEPGAQLYFSGPRVIAETTREALPAGFGSAERMLSLGHLDAVVPRAELRTKISRYIRLLGGGEGFGEGPRQRPRKRGASGLAQTAFDRARTFAAHARGSFVRGDREAPGAPEDAPAGEPPPRP